MDNFEKKLETLESLSEQIKNKNQLQYYILQRVQSILSKNTKNKKD